MSINIGGFVKKLLPSFDKSDIESDLEISLNSISTIQDSYNNLADIIKVAKLESKESKQIILEFYKEIEKLKLPKLTANSNIALDTVMLFKNVKENGDYILREVSDSVNDIIVSGALTAYKANLLRAVAHYYFVTRYALNLINYFYICESETAGIELNKAYKLNNKQKEYITDNMWLYARVLGVYGQEHNKFKSSLEKIEEITLPKEDVDVVIDGYQPNKLDIFNNLPAGFVGSPIYSIRLFFTEWEADRHKSLKDKKKLLELRYLHLKLMKEQNKTDLGMEKEVEDLQKRITDIDYKIAKIEDGIDE